MRAQASNYSRLFYLSILSSFFLMLVFAACAHASGKEVEKKVSEAASAIGNYTIEQKDAAVSKAKEMMDTLDRKTDRLERKLEENWADMQQASREKYQKSLKELREKRNKLSEWYGGMKQSSKDAWSEVKKGFSNTYDGVVKAYKDTEKEMNEKK